jgi:hypothetical protein
VKVDDTSEERKTAEKLLEHLEAAMKEVEEKWGAKVVAIVTDASGECQKARRILGQKYPWLVVLDCYSHQVQLSFRVHSIYLFSRKLDQSRSWKVLQVQCGCLEIFRQGNTTHRMAPQQDSRSRYAP